LIAATATFALNAGLWFRRGLLAMVVSSLAASCCRCAENPPIPAVQISGTTFHRLNSIHDRRKAPGRQKIRDLPRQTLDPRLGINIILQDDLLRRVNEMHHRQPSPAIASQRQYAPVQPFLPG